MLIIIFFIIQWAASSIHLNRKYLSSLYLWVQYGISTFIWYLSFDLPEQIAASHEGHAQLIVLLFTTQAAFVIGIAWLLQYLSKKYNLWNRIYLPSGRFVSIIDPFLVLLFFLTLAVHHKIIDSKNLIPVAYIIFFIAFAIVIILFGMYLVAQYKKLETDNELLRKTLSAEQNMYEFSREFQHDLNALLISMKGLLHEQKIEESLTFLENLEGQTMPVYKNQYYSQIEFVANLPIKALLHQFISNCITTDIPCKVSITNDLANIETDLLDFIRAISIILNNAYEARTNFQGSSYFIELIISEDHKQTTFFTVKNPTNLGLSLGHIFKRGYSSKAEHKGLGLTTLTRIAKRYPNVELNYHLQNNILSAGLKIMSLEKSSHIPNS
ncbi:sensor histidine kinase [Listeria floridensis FSL S10-1187]|uniref:Sensor histidine kinase n=1 Tax=Listeria floridensis FSL S10-1187 TaxID=1265817 RepID=A0ABN0REK2_9LIST|nr:GHKL domain-containing protein [Listeria floridensis]EUJ31334.1 sensor histidine kinase [Listeria floridensis FSL S10-1187]